MCRQNLKTISSYQNKKIYPHQHVWKRLICELLLKHQIYDKCSKCPWDSMHVSTRLIMDRRICSKLPVQLQVV
jgi:hypothetical protein